MSASDPATTARGLRLPSARGPVSRWCVAMMTERRHTPHSTDPTVGLADVDVLTDDDVQLALWMLYELHYLGFDDVDPSLEWDPALLTVRREIERHVEAQLRARTGRVVDDAATTSTDVAQSIFDLCAADDAPAVVAYVHRSADREQLLELLMHRSVYQLKEADPQTWILPRLRGAPKSALLEVQYDEYGAGRVEDMHQILFANTLAACDLDPAYGSYVDDAPGTTLALSNTVSMFGLHRRLRAAAAGHFAAVEATSSLPSRKMSAAMERLGFGEQARHFYDEHIEADAVHEQVAARELCGGLVGQDPDLRRDVLFGAAAYLLMEGLFAESVLTAWQDSRTSLYPRGTRDARVPADGRATA